MRLLMAPQRLTYLLLRREGILHGLHRPVQQRQLLLFAGALKMRLPCVLRQRHAVPRPVADQHRAHTAQPLVEIRQHLQKLGMLLTVPEDTGLVLMEPGVLRQRLGIPGSKLAQGQIHEPPPLRCPRPYEEQILRAEEYSVQHVGQRRAGFGRYAVHRHFSPFAAEKLYLRGERSFP